MIITIGSATMRASGMKSSLVVRLAAEKFVDRREAGNRHEMSEKSVAVGRLSRRVVHRPRLPPRPVFENDWLFEDASVRRRAAGLSSLTPPSETD
jgi:hypothetical protein